MCHSRSGAYRIQIKVRLVPDAKMKQITRSIPQLTRLTKDRTSTEKRKRESEATFTTGTTHVDNRWRFAAVVVSTRIEPRHGPTSPGAEFAVNLLFRTMRLRRLVSQSDVDSSRAPIRPIAVEFGPCRWMWDVWEQWSACSLAVSLLFGLAGN
ncbi:hypothetical protein QR680_014363 [Steinernema hermaphroditum]|uniref:Uncharacterized protein n=1 Tax=Steinernema hermaphroditum TaxID=289476 RepID=A0AA39IA77_9BILA|nr:hypothetical protein QR680_014363 [Steinernema hermaphroditum]